ncbi:uncharacterized protein BCR38DRAFT_487220 [Pseudomassariella vexata]|uniref:DUF7702 domain-containing protein n=1 Tax=Pseudomassariella vexata TaxID=1141098 RepID=A0A1Y2DQ92_9PEZI|nr:uncharacterized protein BCR38DRAFT_487220 [Pseudomassariella vexata]ORY61463.1 hypothetical protein BCR38DRAFT_487220 [Pseudomassariella vexata]
MFALRDAIFLIELAIYCPIIPAIIFIILIHGGRKPYTWRPIIIPLLLLSGLRISGAALGLTAMNPDKSTLLTTATLLDTIGLAPVLCLLIGLLIRANTPVFRGLPLWVFIPLQMVAVAATVMTAYGGRDLYSAGQNQAQDLRLMRAGIFLFIAAFSATVILAVTTLLKVREKCYRTERATAVCALLSVPFMSVRLAFSVGSLFSGQDSVLNPLSDDEAGIWLHFFMVIVMEYVATLSATAVALTARRVVTMIAGKDELLSDDE